jgi:hypothetical protein
MTSQGIKRRGVVLLGKSKPFKGPGLLTFSSVSPMSSVGNGLNAHQSGTGCGLRQPLHPHARGVEPIGGAVGRERAKLHVPRSAIVHDPPQR